jgi:hypothetical protein
MTHWLAAANKKILYDDELHRKCFERTGMLIKLKAGLDDEKVKPQGLRLPYIIPAEVESYPPEVPTVTDSASSIENVNDNEIGDDAAPGDIVIEEEEANLIHDILLDCAGVSGDQELLLNCLWENVAR